MAEFETFKVERLLYSDVGRNRVRLHLQKRDGASRFAVVKLTAKGGQNAFAVVLGHNKAKDVICMDFDLRSSLDVNENDTIELKVEKVRRCGRLLWYLRATDPAIRIPAWLALWSVGLGLVGTVLAVISLISMKGYL